MKYIANNVVSFGAGAVLGLSKDQAASRTHFITPVPGKIGMYTTNGPVQFKRGEEFIFDGNLPKNLADSVESMKKAKTDKEATRAAPEAKAKAEIEVKAKAEAEAAALERAQSNPSGAA